MKIAYFGLPLGALLLARDGHELVVVASPRADAIGNRRAARVFGARFAICPRASEAALLGRLSAAAPDLLVSWFWTRRLPPALVSACPLGGFGVHPSLLPRHRGPDPYFWAIEGGDTITGVSAHRLAAEYDTGAVLAQRALAIAPSWNAWQLAKQLDRPSLALLREVASAFARGAPPADVVQDESQATLAPEPDEDLRALRLSASTAEVLRRIRALAPSPGAELALGDAVVTVTRAEEVPRFPKALAPGEAFVDPTGRAIVRTGDGAIALLAGERFDEEASSALDAAAFALLLGAELMLRSLSKRSFPRRSGPHVRSDESGEAST